MKRTLIILTLFIFSCDEEDAIDTTAPVITITSPINESTLSAQTIIKVDVADVGGIVSVTFLVNGDSAFVDTASPYEYDWDICTLEDTAHTLLAKATDKAGNTGQSELFTFTIDADYDCANECGGILVNDECGECGGSGILDECGVCDNDESNNCLQGCDGVWGSGLIYDECGDCDGDNSNCTGCDGIPNSGLVLDCADVCGGDSYVDDCGVCGGSDYFIDGLLPNGVCDCDGNIEDCAGVCGGDNFYTDATCGDCSVNLWDTCYNIETTTELQLFNNQLTGEIPSEIGHLTNLTELVLSNNQLTGEIPSEIGNLINLTSLQLGNNQLTTLPSELGNLINLDFLEINNNQLTGEIPSSLGNLINLGYLSFEYNQLTGEIPSSLGNLINIYTLQLWYNQLSGEIPQEVCDLISSNYLSPNNFFDGNNLTNTCD